MEKWDKRQAGDSASFLQSALWGKFQKSIGNKPHFLSGDGWSCLVLEKSNRLCKYLFAPYGPTLGSPAQLDAALKAIIDLGKQLGASWVKLEPRISTGEMPDLIGGLKAAGARRASHNNEPALTRVIDLSPDPETILAGISQSTRSLIRKNQRENFLVFKTSDKPEDLGKFTDMLDVIADRKGIGFFSKDYFIKQGRLLMPAKMMFLETAFSGKKVMGYAVMHDYGETSSYTYAASLPEARKLSVSALLLWQAALNAKARGNKQLDLYGIAPEDAPPSHPWYGFSTYKKKFGGTVFEMSGTWDIPLSNKYKFYRGAQKAHRLLRKI